MEDLDFYQRETITTFPKTKAKTAFTFPEKIGPYKIDSLLHQGNHSIVFLASDTTTKKALAIKVLSPELVHNHAACMQFLSETKVIALSDHQNIVKLYDQGQFLKQPYIAMEFIQGVSLNQFIEEHSLTLSRSLEIILQISYAIMHLHTHSIIHRDIKPENILINDNGTVKVIDFGTAQIHNNNKLIQNNIQTVGTPSYISPEQIINPHSISYNSDIYSLGVLAYELIVGKLSFGHIDLTLIPEILRKVISKALQKDPNNRYQDIVDFIADITPLFKKISEENQKTSLPLKTLTEVYQQSLLNCFEPIDEIDLGIAPLLSTLPIQNFIASHKISPTKILYSIAYFPQETIKAFASLLTFRSLYLSIIHPNLHENKDQFLLENFMQQLNNAIYHEPLLEDFQYISFYADLYENRCHILSNFSTQLFHLTTQTGHVTEISLNATSLGKDLTFNLPESHDTFQPGDLITLTTLKTPNEDIKRKTRDLYHEKSNASPHALAEEFFYRITKNESKKTPLILALQRIT